MPSKPLRSLLLASLGALPTLVACHAPTPSTPQTPSSDAQAAVEPRSAPGAGQQLLARMAGDWQVEKTIHRRSGGEPVRSHGTCRQEMVHDGRFLRSEFVFDGDASRAASTGTGVIGFDPATGVFTSFWYDSRSTRVSVRQSEGAFDGEAIELVSRTIGGEAAARRSHTTTRFDGDDRLVHRQWSVAADGSEQLFMELVLTRTGS
ncbi:MAG: DUF1579 family protein [Planctomycetes bacterium]|nr:DUF1579 family protein [Planctomycetota bacterium]